MNELSSVPSQGEGVFRRVKIVKFPQMEGEVDPDIREGIKGEGGAVLAWAVKGLIRLRKRGRFLIPDSVTDAVKEWERNNDVPRLFVEERCVTGEGKRVKSSELYRAYKEWCMDTGHYAKANNRITEDWERLGFENVRPGNVSYYKGLDLREYNQ